MFNVLITIFLTKKNTTLWFVSCEGENTKETQTIAGPLLGNSGNEKLLFNGKKTPAELEREPLVRAKEREQSER